MALVVTKFFLVLGFAAAYANGRFVISRPEVSHKNYKLFSNFEDENHPTTNFVPSSLKVEEGTFSKLMEKLDQQVSDDFNLKSVAGYFPKDVESDEWDELEYINSYDEAVDEEDIDAIFNVPDDGASVTAQFGRREFSFSKVLAVNKNGTKTFSKIRQSVRVTGDAKASISGNPNTTVVDASSASANFVANVSISSRGKDTRTVVSGDTSIKSNSKSRVEKRRSLSDTSVQASTKVRISSLDEDVTVNTVSHTGSETFRLPFRTFFTLFGSSSNVSTDYGVGSHGRIGGEVTSHVAFASRNHSLTKSYVKVFVKTVATSSRITDNDEDDDQDISEDGSSSGNGDQSDEASNNVVQVVLVKAKTHTWTKTVSASKSEIVLDIITATKARAYSKGILKGKAVVFSGTGQVQWEKTQLRLTGTDLEQVSPHEYGIYHVSKLVESGSLFGSLASAGH